MGSVLVTGSTAGIGIMVARELLADGHDVVLHARNEARAADALAAVPDARTVLIGDLASLAETRGLASEANLAGPFDGVVHNAGIGAERTRTLTEDGLEQIFQINVLAPYVLTALVPARRLVYMGSAAHMDGNVDVSLGDLTCDTRPWDGLQAYSDSKLLDVVLAFAIARRWSDVYANGVGPGWVATRMGGDDAPDELALAARTQTWLMSDDDPAANVSGRYFFHQEEYERHPAVSDAAVQECLLDVCEHVSGIGLPPPR